MQSADCRLRTMQSADCILSPMQSADCAGSQIACNSNTLCRVLSISSVNAGGYIFIKNTGNGGIPAWIWSGYQGTHQLNFPEIR